MTPDAQHARRRLASSVASGVASGTVAVALVAVVAILSSVLRQGASAFVTGRVRGAGVGNAILGTLELVLLASIFAVPLGIAAGLYLAEVRTTRLARAVRFAADILAGVPSILVGIVVYATLVVRMKHFSALGGGVALAIVMLPIVTRTTDALARAVPDSLREAALALGAPRWRIATHVVLRTAGRGIRAGCMLAVARVCGETAPLLFTAFDSQLWSASPLAPTSSLQVRIFTFTMQGGDDHHAQAWASALVLVFLVVGLHLAARHLARDPA